jgi:hypothetical protein
MIRPVIIEGAVFEVGAQEQSDGVWHWLITAPGRLVLSGEAPNETQALLSAFRAGQALAKMMGA